MTDPFIEDYPETIYASVLLIENKIYNWKIGRSPWREIGDVRMRMSDFQKYKGEMTLLSKEWVVHSTAENQEVFEIKAREWMRQWEPHPNLIGATPFQSDEDLPGIPY